MNDSARSTLDHFLNAPLFTLARTPVTVLTLVTFALLLVITLWLARLAERGTRRAFAMRGVTEEGTPGIAARLIQYAVVLLGLGVALQTLGIDLGALFAAGAFFAVAIGFAMQNVAQNFISGIILLTERTIKPGDVLTVDGQVVRVTRMGLRATVARTRDDEDLIIPNSTLVQNVVTNHTLRDAIYRVRSKVGVAYESDLDRVAQVLFDAATSLPGRLESREPRILLTEFGDSSVNFEISVWTQDPWRSRVSISELNNAIWRALREARIVIPFPQRDVHIIRGATDGE
jgi:small-conductance mechanosensitive channel